MSDEYLEQFKESMYALQDAGYGLELVEQDIFKLSVENSSGSSIAFVGLTHGDEVIGLHVLTELALRIVEKRIIPHADIYFILANRAAYLENTRYINTDLNRSYGNMDDPRAEQIKKIVKNCEYVVDFHQTIEPTPNPFFILPFSVESYRWLSQIAPSIPVISKGVSNKITTLSSYVNSLGKKGVTLEVGANGVDIYQLEIGLQVAQNVIKFSIDNGLELNALRQKSPLYTIEYFQEYKRGKVVFTKDYNNFDYIEKDEVIANVDGQEIITPISGNILLYPKKWFKPDSKTKADGLFFVLQKS